MSAQSHSSRLHTVDQVRRIDETAIRGHGIAGIELMQRAADAAYAVLRRRWPTARRLLVVAGSGNNGGDAFLLAQKARAAGLDVELVALGGESQGDAATARSRWLGDGGTIILAEEDMRLADADVVVDGLFGVGLSRAPEGLAAVLLERMNAVPAARFALDEIRSARGHR